MKNSLLCIVLMLGLGQIAAQKTNSVSTKNEIKLNTLTEPGFHH